jgi:hypothetical protein
MQQYSKAIAAFITPFILTLVMPLGLNGDSSLVSVIEAVVLSGLTSLSVYMVANKK